MEENEELIAALRCCDQVVNNTENTLQCGVCPYFQNCASLDQKAADVIEVISADNAALKADLARVTAQRDATWQKIGHHR